MSRHTVTCFPRQRTYTHFTRGRDNKIVEVEEQETIVQHDIYRPKDAKHEFYWRGARIEKP